jgi:hypothetical protein
VFGAVDVHYLRSGGARAAVVVAADAAFSTVLAEHSAVVAEVMGYRPGEFYRRELPPLRAVLRGVCGLGLLVIDGYAVGAHQPRPSRPQSRPTSRRHAMGRIGTLPRGLRPRGGAVMPATLSCAAGGQSICRRRPAPGPGW